MRYNGRMGQWEVVEGIIASKAQVLLYQFLNLYK